MIKINFEEPDTRIWKNWRRDCEREMEVLIRSGEKGEEINIRDLYRRKSIKDGVYMNKAGPFSGKCAYCETYIADFQHGDVEHYRPKKGVTDENDFPILVESKGGGRDPHPGYYWLAYDWKNLLPSCVKCNQASVIGDEKVGKHNRFPVSGIHATTPAEVDREKPLLLNPTVDEPQEHLQIDVNSGLMEARTDRGAMCIRIFALNLRDRLPEERKKAIEAVRAELIKTIISPVDKGGVKQILSDIKDSKHSYAMARRAALSDARSKLNPISGDS